MDGPYSRRLQMSDDLTVFLLAEGLDSFNLNLTGVSLLRQGLVGDPALSETVRYLKQRCGERMWDGDGAMVTWLDEAVSGRLSGTVVTGDVDLIAEVMDTTWDDQYPYLDVATGTIDFSDTSVDENDPSVVPMDHLSDSSQAWDDRRWFARRVDDGDLARALLDALNGGRGAFRRFGDVMYDAPEQVRHQWQDFEEERKRGRAIQWLHDNDLRVGPT